MIRLDGTSIIPGEIAIFRIAFVLAMAVLIFEIVIAASLCAIVSFTIVRNTSCVCKDFAPSPRIDHLVLACVPNTAYT